MPEHHIYTGSQQHLYDSQTAGHDAEFLQGTRLNESNRVEKKCRSCGGYFALDAFPSYLSGPERHICHWCQKD